MGESPSEDDSPQPAPSRLRAVYARTVYAVATPTGAAALTDGASPGSRSWTRTSDLPC